MSPNGRRSHFLVEAAGWAGTFRLTVGADARTLAGRARLAGDSTARRRGLLGRPQLTEDEALVIAPTFAIHTFGMAFSIDVAFADRQGRILAIAERVPPGRVRFRWGAFAAVELPAGRCRQVGAASGEQLTAVSGDPDR